MVSRMPLVICDVLAAAVAVDRHIRPRRNVMSGVLFITLKMVVTSDLLTEMSVQVSTVGFKMDTSVLRLRTSNMVFSSWA
jgi:hypothetical protein